MTERKNPDLAQPPGSCPDDMTVAAFIDGNLRGEELRQVEAHLAVCRDCALAVEELREDLAEPLEPIPPEESERFVAFAMAAVQRQWDARNERNAKAKRDRERARRVSRFRRFAAVAACFVAVLAISVVAHRQYMLRSDSAGRHESAASATSRDSGASLPGTEATGSAWSVASAASSAGAPGEQAAYRAKQPASQELLADADVQKDLDELLAQAEVDAVLPHTDAEYEAWAREEYPHIMWLYDVLTKPEYGIEWNGDPVSVPTWGERLYADVPPAERPKGWRALVVYSGEALRFDYPTDPGQPNVRPRLEAIQLAAAVAGFEARFVGEASKVPASEGGPMPPSSRVSSHIVPGSTGSTMSTGSTPSTGSSRKSGAEGIRVAENSEARDSVPAATTKRFPLPALTWAEQGGKALAMSAELVRPEKEGRVVAAVAAAAIASDSATVPRGYFTAVSARPDLAQSLLRYVAVSDLVMGTPASTSLSHEAQALLLQLAPLGQKATGTPSCTMTLPSSTLESLFSSRRGLLDSLAGQEGGSR
jgi:hypothetical protein